MRKFWNDEAGFVTLEYLFGATILVIGMVVGLVALKNSINAELGELGEAIQALSQGYSFNGEAFCNSAATDGSQASDTAGHLNYTGVAPTSSTVAVTDCPAAP